MSSKLMNKKLLNKRTPLRLSFTQNRQILPSTSSTIYNAIGKQFSMEEYNKVMIQNQRLAKENAYLKSNFSSCKESLLLATNETIELKQQLIVANNQIERLKTDLKNKNFSEITKFSEQLKNAANLLMEDYLSIDEIKRNINQLGERIQTFRGLMSSLESLIDGKNQLKESQDSDLNSERIDSFISFNSSIRYSLSSQDIDLRRRLSTERIRRDFQIMSELSTICEISREQRSSSLAFDGNNISKNMSDSNSKETVLAPNNALPMNEKTTTTSSFTVSSVGCDSVPSVPIKEKKTAKRTKPKAKKKIISIKNVLSPQNKTKTDSKQNNKISKQMKCKKTETNIENDLSIYEFTEDVNQENIIPIKPVQRASQRIRNKRLSLK